MNKREQLLDRMIKIYGFEHELVIEFAGMIENPNYKTEILETLVKCHEACPQITDEEDLQALFFCARRAFCRRAPKNPFYHTCRFLSREKLHKFSSKFYPKIRHFFKSEKSVFSC